MKQKKIVCASEDVKENFIHITALKEALNHGLRLKNVHRVIRFNQQTSLKPYIDMNTALRKQSKNKFENKFFS